MSSAMSIISAFAEEKGVVIKITDAGEICTGTSTDFQAPPFVRYNNSQRLQPQLTMPDAKSIIVIGCGVEACYEESNSTCNQIGSSHSCSPGSYRRDYHNILRALMSQLIHRLSQFGCSFMAFTDTGPLYEKGLALKAGLGFVCKNNLLACESFGTFFHIGYILTDMELPQNFSEPAGISNNPRETSNLFLDACSQCNICENVCPSGALSNGYDFTRCISYLTQCKELTQEQEEIIKGNLYGCELCQRFCPLNAGKFIPPADSLSEQELQALLSMSNKTFDAKYRGRSFHWLGLRRLKRNAGLCLSQ